MLYYDNERVKNNHKHKKSLGQHFLTDQSIASKIVNSLSFSKNHSDIIEIGPGQGVLTKFLSKKNSHQIHIIEIDKELIEGLKNNYPNVNVIYNNYLSINLKELATNGSIALIGNLPYNISSSILFKSLENKDVIEEMVFMLQKEVAERITSKHGNKQYGILSVLLQAYYNVEYLFTVPPELFDPIPKVYSGVIRLKRINRALKCEHKNFIKIVKLAFQQRRKKLRNALKCLQVPNDILVDFNEKRAEQLSIEDFIELTLEIENYQKVILYDK